MTEKQAYIHMGMTHPSDYDCGQAERERRTLARVQRDLQQLSSTVEAARYTAYVPFSEPGDGSLYDRLGMLLDAVRALPVV